MTGENNDEFENLIPLKAGENMLIDIEPNRRPPTIVEFLEISLGWVFLVNIRHAKNRYDGKPSRPLLTMASLALLLRSREF